MADDSNRIRKGFEPLYKPGSYKGFGMDSDHKVTKPPNSEAPNGVSKGGETGNPVRWKVDDDKDD